MRAFVRTSTRACGVALLLVLALLPAQAFLPAATRGPSAVHRARQVTMSATAGHVPPTAAPSAAAKRPRREINVVNVLTTKGGYMARVEVHNFNVASHHHVTTSKELLASTLELAGVSVPEGQEPPVEEYYKAVFKFMLQKGMPLANTEGMINAGVFPINLFAVKQLDYFQPDATEGIAAILKDTIGQH